MITVAAPSCQSIAEIAPRAVIGPSIASTSRLPISTGRHEDLTD